MTSPLEDCSKKRLLDVFADLQRLAVMLLPWLLNFTNDDDIHVNTTQRATLIPTTKFDHHAFIGFSGVGIFAIVSASLILILFITFSIAYRQKWSIVKMEFREQNTQVEVVSEEL